MKNHALHKVLMFRARPSSTKLIYLQRNACCRNHRHQDPVPVLALLIESTSIGFARAWLQALQSRNGDPYIVKIEMAIPNLVALVRNTQLDLVRPGTSESDPLAKA